MNDPATMTGTLLTPKQVAAYLNVSPKTVYRHAWDGTWPCMWVGRRLRFVLADVVDAIKRSGDHRTKDLPTVSNEVH